MDSGCLSWNGNGVSGSDRILKFLIDLPSSDHTVNTLDAQPILGELIVNDLWISG